MVNEAIMKKTSKTLVGSYAIPLVADDFRISLHLYKTEDSYEIVHKYYDDLVKDMAVSEPAIEMLDSICVENDDEVLIFINLDLCPEEERLNLLVYCLFKAATIISDRMESEEFGARVIGAAFEKFAPLFDSQLTHKPAPSLRGMSLCSYGIPLLSEDHRITLNIYDDENIDDVRQTLDEVYRDRILSGKFNPQNTYGFAAQPHKAEDAIFINAQNAPGFLMHEKVLVHEIFHTVTSIIKTFDDSLELGARLSLCIFREFSHVLGQELS